MLAKTSILNPHVCREFEAYKFEIFSAIILHMGVVIDCGARNVIHGFEISAFSIFQTPF